MPPDDQVPKVALPRSLHRKILIFDLDETLVHCVENIDEEQYDLPIVV